MMLDEFLAALRKTPRDWRLTQNGAIRRYGGSDYCSQCPLTAVAGFGTGQGQWAHVGPAWYREAAKKIGLALRVADRIAAGADSRRGSLRHQILDACGLSEGGKAERRDE